MIFHLSTAAVEVLYERNASCVVYGVTEQYIAVTVRAVNGTLRNITMPGEGSY